MGRYNGSSGGGAGSAQEIISTVLPAGEAIQRGDLVLVGGDGKGYVAALPTDAEIYRAIRPSAGGAQLEHFRLASSFAVAAAYNDAYGDTFDVIKLSNGNLLVTSPDASESTYGVPVFSLFDSDGKVIISQRGIPNINGATAARNVPAIALPNGGFAIAYLTGSGLWLSIHDATGAQVRAPFSVGNSVQYGVRMALLENGTIAIATCGSLTVSYSVWKTDGTAVKASTQLASGQNGAWRDRIMAVTALVGGGFAIGYVVGITTGTCQAYSQVFSSAGVSLGATPLWPTPGNNGYGGCHMTPLQDGGYAFAATGNTIGGYLGFYNAQGAVRRSIKLGNLINEDAGNCIGLATAPNGNVGVVYTTSSATVGTAAAIYNPAGEVVAAPRTVEAYNAWSQCGPLSFNEDGSAYFAASAYAAGQSLPRVYVLDAAFNVTGKMQLTGTTIWNSPRPKIFSTKHSKVDEPCYALAYQEGTAKGIVLSIYLGMRQQMTLLGVATNNAPKGNSASVQMTGMVVLRKRFSQPWTANQQGANPPGQRMQAMGNTAVLSGIQSDISNQIN